MSTLTKTLRWGLHLLGENAEARIRELTRKVEGLQAAYDLLSASAETDRQEARELRAERDRLRDRLTPRTYREGDPRPEGMVLWWSQWKHARGWLLLRPDLLDPGDRWLPLPPPLGEPWTGTAAPLDAYDALAKVTQERDEARRALADMEDLVLGMRQERDAARAALDALRAEHTATVQGYRAELDAARVERDVAFASKAAAEQVLYDLTRERDEARDLLSRLTPRTYCEGDPYPTATSVLWWREWKHDQGWRWLRSDMLAPGDVYFDLPPPSEWPLWIRPQSLNAVEEELREADKTNARLVRQRNEAHAELLRRAADLGAAAFGLAAGLDAHRRLSRVREQARNWGWTEEAIASLLALPGEQRTHIFPAPEPASTLEEINALASSATTWQELDARLSAAGAVDWPAVRAAVGRLYWASRGCEIGAPMHEAIAALLVVRDQECARQARGLACKVLARRDEAPLLQSHIEEVCKLLGVDIKAPEVGRKCPRCGSPDPARHPAVQHEGEVQICHDPFHGAGDKPEVGRTDPWSGSHHEYCDILVLS